MASQQTDSSKAANSRTPGPRAENGFGVGAPTHPGNGRGGSWHRGVGQGRGVPGPYGGNQYGDGFGGRGGYRGGRSRGDWLGHGGRGRGLPGPYRGNQYGTGRGGGNGVAGVGNGVAGVGNGVAGGNGNPPQGVNGRGRGVPGPYRGNQYGPGRGGGVGNGVAVGNGNPPQGVKRSREEESDDTLASRFKKRVNVGSAAKSIVLMPNQVQVERDIYGGVMTIKPLDPNGPRYFSTHSVILRGATDVVMNPRQTAGYDGFFDVTRGYVEQGADELVVTVKPVFNRPRSVGGYNTPMDLSKARVMEDDSEHCEACSSDGHETKGCPIPSNYGDTVIDPFCNLSIKAQVKGDVSRHSLDGNRVSDPGHDKYLYCPVMVRYGREEAAKNLRSLFNTFVIGRLRMPPIRVVKEQYCFIRIALDVSDRWYEGDMPPEMHGVWPYTKQDAIKYMDNLDDFDRHGWARMPKGQLEELGWETVRMEYEAGRIPKQIRSRSNKRSVQGPSESGLATDSDTDMEGSPVIPTVEVSTETVEELRGASLDTTNVTGTSPSPEALDNSFEDALYALMYIQFDRAPRDTDSISLD